LGGLSIEEKDNINNSTEHWRTYLTRDFMPPWGTLLLEAIAEQFNWNQNRTPMEYATKKISLPWIAGITGQDTIVNTVHAGFQATPTLMVALQPFVLARGNTVCGYTEQLALIQGPLQQIHDDSRTPSTRQPRRPQPGPMQSEYRPQGGMVATPEQSPVSQRREAAIVPYTAAAPPISVRSRRTAECVQKYSFYPDPECRDGEHWDRECKLYGRIQSTWVARSYYIRPEVENDLLEGTEENFAVKELDEDEDSADKYDRAQTAHFGELYFSTQPGFHALIRASDSKNSIPAATHVCNVCKEGFGSGNALHRHLRETERNKSMEQPPHLVESKAEMGSDPTAGLRDYHYVKLPFSTSIAGATHLACMDTGYGNSAVDKTFLQKCAAGASCITLPQPQWVLGMGGGRKLLDEVAMLTIYLRGNDGRMATFTRPFRVFVDLSVPLLVGIDIIALEDMVLTFKPTPAVMIGSCAGVRVPVTLRQEQQYRKILVRIRNPIKLPPRRTMKVNVRLSQKLNAEETYLFSPSPLHSATSSGVGAPHAMVSYDQSQIAFTNFLHTPVQLFKGTVIGIMQPMSGAHYVAWEEAQMEVMAMFGAEAPPPVATVDHSINRPIFDLDAVTPTDFPPMEEMSFPYRARMAPGKEPVQPSQHPEKPCREEKWDLPPWIQEEYIPTYAYPLPAGIKTPSTATTTWEEVKVNETDDVSPEQVEAKKLLLRRHKAIFNDEMGCVRESPDDW